MRSFEEQLRNFVVPIYDFGGDLQCGVQPTKIAVPQLDVPPAPVEPKPEPESASVQLLRSLLDERRTELKAATAVRNSRIKQAEEAERRAADLRSRAAGDDRIIDAAQESIQQVLMDIGLVGRRSG